MWWLTGLGYLEAGDKKGSEISHGSKCVASLRKGGKIGFVGNMLHYFRICWFEGSIEHACREAEYASKVLREDSRIRLGVGSFRERETLKPWKYISFIVWFLLYITIHYNRTLSPLPEWSSSLSSTQITGINPDPPEKGFSSFKVELKQMS